MAAQNLVSPAAAAPSSPRSTPNTTKAEAAKPTKKGKATTLAAYLDGLRGKIKPGKAKLPTIKKWGSVATKAQRQANAYRVLMGESWAASLPERGRKAAIKAIATRNGIGESLAERWISTARWVTQLIEAQPETGIDVLDMPMDKIVPKAKRLLGVDTGGGSSQATAEEKARASATRSAKKAICIIKACEDVGTRRTTLTLLVEDLEAQVAEAKALLDALPDGDEDKELKPTADATDEGQPAPGVGPLPEPEPAPKKKGTTKGTQRPTASVIIVGDKAVAWDNGGAKAVLQLATEAGVTPGRVVALGAHLKANKVRTKPAAWLQAPTLPTLDEWVAQQGPRLVPSPEVSHG